MAGLSGIEFWTTHSLDKIFPDNERPPRAGGEVSLCAGRGEVEDAQIAVRVPPGVEVRQAAFELGDLTGPDGARIDRACVEARWQWYTWVTHNPPQNRDPATCLRQAPAFFPDGLLEQETIRILPARTQPLWVCVRVPGDAAPGRYDGLVRLHLVDAAGECADLEVPLRLDVWPFELPGHNRLRHTEWFSAAALADYYRLEMWSEGHWRWIERVARDMGRHRQDMILTSFPALVDITRRAEGGVAFDFARLDRWVHLFAQQGVTWIEGGHVAGRTGGWESEFRLHRFSVRGPDGRPVDTSREAMPEAEFEPIVQALLNASHARLKELGCAGRCVQHIADEPVQSNQDSWRRISSLVREWLPDVPRIDATMAPGLAGCVEMRVPQIQHLTAPSTAKPPEELWSYVCLAPQGIYPNRFVDYASIRNRIIFWLSWTLGLKGFLHWGYNHWGAWTNCPVGIRVSPWTDPSGASVHCQDNNPLPAGDPFIVYPGEQSICPSLRWEVIRKGMEDFEYLCLLEDLAADSTPGPARDRAARLLERVRTDIAPDPARHTHDAELLLATRGEIGRTIADLRNQ